MSLDYFLSNVAGWCRSGVNQVICMSLSLDGRVWLCTLLVAWIGGIFFLASGRGSISRTARFVLPTLHPLFPRARDRDLNFYHAVIRKLCHLGATRFLALLAAGTAYYWSFPEVAKLWHLSALGVVVFIAALDEFRQSFYGSRVGSLSDVALDCVGGAMGILLYWLVVDRDFV